MRRGSSSWAARTSSSLNLLFDHFCFADLDLGSAAAKPGGEKIGRDFKMLRLPYRTLPDRRHTPSGCEQRASRGIVPDNVCLELRLPVNGRVKVSQRAAQNVATLGLE